ncbi:MAG: HEAT repeat domain-containing protein [Planctomycetales bacterium]|nr:HEAT repeat domain-containing protein [Planctomycetales bacterium]
MWSLSPSAQTDVGELRELLRRPAAQPESFAQLLLRRLALHGEPAALPVVLDALQKGVCRPLAAAAIHRLLMELPPGDLPHLERVFGRAYGWLCSSEVTKKDVAGAAGFGAHRTAVLGLLSLHRNGHVRHEALAELGRVHSGDELRFLLLRLNDWVEPIHRDARELVQQRLASDYLEHFLAALPLVVRLMACRRRDLRDLVVGLVESLVGSGLLEQAFAHRDRDSSRCVAELAMTTAGVDRQKLVEIGLRSSDPVIRLRYARFAKGSPPEAALEACGQMLGDRFMPVRREGLLLKAELCPELRDEIWCACLFDRSRSLRELARFQLRGFKIDIADVYRRAVSESEADWIAVAGLAETGDESDLPLFRELLGSSSCRIRAQAVVGLGRLGSEQDRDRLAASLRDSSSRVAGEAARQILSQPANVGPEYWEQLLTDDLPDHGGRVILRIVFGLGRWASLPTLLRVAATGRPALAQYADKMLELWSTPPRSLRIFTRPTDRQRQQLLEALADARQSLRPKLLAELFVWLTACGLVPPPRKSL